MPGGAGDALPDAQGGSEALGRKTSSSGRSDGEQERDMQKEAPEKYQEKIFEEFKELEEQKGFVARSKEAYADQV